MTMTLPATAAVLCLALLACSCAPGPNREGTSAQTGTGEIEARETGDWIFLLGDEDAEQWRGFRMDALPDAWTVEGGVLGFRPGGQGGDIVTRERFADFELELEWRLQAAGNSGIFFRVTEDVDRTFESGAEVQVLDNAGHADGRNPLTSAGANYALHAPSADATRPVGEWNQVRLLVRGPHVEHWLNGIKVVEYELWTEDWQSLVAGSKFVEWPSYGLAHEGHIALQDHGDPVWFRNIRIRRLD